MKSLSLIAAALAIGSATALYEPSDHPLIKFAKLDRRQGGISSIVNSMFNRRFEDKNGD
jgi:hypothetical protein